MVAHVFQRNGESKIIYILRIIGLVILGLIGAVAIALLLGYVVVWLWNWLMPELFGLTTITFWQAVVLIILARIIFGGFKHSRGDHPKDRFASRKKRIWTRHPFDRKWKYYEDYWRDEGEKAFDDYVRRKEEK
jgi:hypothetical protein